MSQQLTRLVGLSAFAAMAVLILAELARRLPL